MAASITVSVGFYTPKGLRLFQPSATATGWSKKESHQWKSR